MIRELSIRVSAVFMAFLVMASTVSFTVEKHFCGDHLVDAALFSEAQKCKMEAMAAQMDMPGKKSCCKDVTERIQGQDDLKLNVFEYPDFEDQDLVFEAVFNVLVSDELLPKEYIPLDKYIPPKLVYDICLQNEVFLI